MPTDAANSGGGYASRIADSRVGAGDLTQIVQAVQVLLYQVLAHGTSVCDGAAEMACKPLANRLQ